MGAWLFALVFITLYLLILFILKVMGLKEISFEGGEEHVRSWRCGSCQITFLHPSENPYHFRKWFHRNRSKWS
jgi:hypothetical protein